MYKRKVSFAGKKKGVSVMVSYVLLIVFVIIIGALVYQWLKSYVPAQAMECPDGVSIFIKEAYFDPFDSRLIVTLRNNGRFSLAGYFIHATNSSDQELPIIDLSGYLNYTDGPGKIHGNSVAFIIATGNLFHPGSENSYFFDIPSSIGKPYLIRITPTRFQEVDERQRFVSCSDARAGQLVGLLKGWMVFVSKTASYYGDLGGLSGADDECNILAGNANLNGTFIAWLSNETINAKDRIEEGVFFLFDNTKLANSKDELLNSTLLTPINIDQEGGLITGGFPVWTGTNEFGNLIENQHCNNWVSQSVELSGIRGYTNRSDIKWTNWLTETCDDDQRIYCFQIE